MKFIERHHDYVFSAGSLAAGIQLLSQPLQLDADAPFALRGRAIYARQTNNIPNPDGLFSRFQDADYHYRASDLLPTDLDILLRGWNGVFSPVRPQILYPAKGTIVTDILNPSSNSDRKEVTVIYRGVKAFPNGSVLARSFPSGKIKLQSCSYTQSVVIHAVETLRQIPCDIKQDADFILRGGQAYTVEVAGNQRGIMIQLMDENLQPYSSAPIPIDYFFGNGVTGVTNTADNVVISNWIPGLIYPEIYIPASHRLVFDLVRNDPGQIAYTLNINWIGCKVVPA